MSPLGTPDNSPRFKPWVVYHLQTKPRRGGSKGSIDSPLHLPSLRDSYSYGAYQTTDKSVGYYRTSLRDEAADVDCRFRTYILLHNSPNPIRLNASLLILTPMRDGGIAATLIFWWGYLEIRYERFYNLASFPSSF